MALKSPRFASNARLQKAANNAPALNGADCGEPVRLVQQGLIDLGFPMPISVKKFGSPDGIFGAKTKATIKAFQTKHKLTSDGLAGKNTMAKLDELLPTLGKPLPPIEPLVPYLVPGLIDSIKQPTTMGCWATAYTIMNNWRKQASRDVRDTVSDMGDKWLKMYDDNKGLSPSEHIAFARAAGLQFEPLQSMSVDGWAQLLRTYGLLWLCFGWEVAGSNGLPTKKGRHIIVIRGMLGDGTPDATEFRFADPGTGMFHKEPFLDLIAEYELGFTIDGSMPDSTMSGFSQVLHF